MIATLPACEGVPFGTAMLLHPDSSHPFQKAATTLLGAKTHFFSWMKPRLNFPCAFLCPQPHSSVCPQVSTLPDRHPWATGWDLGTQGSGEDFS